MLGSPEVILTVALAGGTGAGKSALINALAGSRIAATSEIRPTTTKIIVYHHREVISGGLPSSLVREAVLVAHERPELRSKVIVDMPDLDSYVIEHRAVAQALLKAAGLVLYIFSPQNYRDERTWSVIHEEKRYSTCAAVLNKADLVSPEDLEVITDHLRREFTPSGLPEIKIFRTVATAPSLNEDSAQSQLAAGLNEMTALYAFLERELHTSDVAQMLRKQREHVVAHLQAELNRVAPEILRVCLEDVAAAFGRQAEPAAIRFTGLLADQLAVVEAELAPLATLRQHERFRGPFRTWLAVVDFLRFGPTGISAHFFRHLADRPAQTVELSLTRDRPTTLSNLLHSELQTVQDLLYSRGLPISRWQTVTASVEEGRLLSEMSTEIDTRVHSAMMKASGSRPHSFGW
jgi:50S ribosome-binding GTPase